LYELWAKNIAYYRQTVKKRETLDTSTASNEIDENKFKQRLRAAHLKLFICLEAC